MPPAANFDFEGLLRAAIRLQRAFPTADPRPIDNAADFVSNTEPDNDTLDSSALDDGSAFDTGDMSFGVGAALREDGVRAVFHEDDARTVFEGDNARTAFEGDNTCTAFEGDDARTAFKGDDARTAFKEGGASDMFDTGSDAAGFEIDSLPASPAPPTHSPLPSTSLHPYPAPNEPLRMTLLSNPPRQSPASAKLWKVARGKKRSKIKKARQRNTRTLGACPEKRAFLVRHLAAQEPYEADFSANNMPHASTSYQGAQGGSGAKRLWTAQECVKKWGHVVKKWDGKTPIPILDRLGRVFGLCAGSPEDDDWGAVSQAAAANIQTARGECSFLKGCGVHRRGRFLALAKGVSYGGGAVRPGNLIHSEVNAHALNKLLSTRAIRRITAFASSKSHFFTLVHHTLNYGCRCV